MIVAAQNCTCAPGRFHHSRVLHFSQRRKDTRLCGTE
jgi:hypothetical protein